MAMTKSQRVAIQAGAVLTVLMFIYPPWVYVDQNKVGHSMGYSPFWQAPSVKTSSAIAPLQTANNLDFNVLILQGILLLVSTAVACKMLVPVPDKSIYARK